MEFPNAGSVFKNCDVKKFKKNILDRVQHVIKTDPFPVVPTAYLLSECNLKGIKIGGAQISEKHPDYIVNIENAKAVDVLQLIERAKKAVKEKFEVALETEIQYLGEF